MLKRTEGKVSFGWELTEEFVSFWVGFLTLKIFAVLRHRRSAAGQKSQPSAIALAWLFFSGGKLYCTHHFLAPLNDINSVSLSGR